MGFKVTRRRLRRTILSAVGIANNRHGPTLTNSCSAAYPSKVRLYQRRELIIHSHRSPLPSKSPDPLGRDHVIRTAGVNADKETKRDIEPEPFPWQTSEGTMILVVYFSVGKF